MLEPRHSWPTALPLCVVSALSGTPATAQSSALEYGSVGFVDVAGVRTHDPLLRGCLPGTRGRDGLHRPDRAHVHVDVAFSDVRPDLVDERRAEWDALIAASNLAPSVAAEYRVVRRFFGTPIAERSLPAHPAVPTAVVLGTKYSEVGMSFAD